MNPNLAISQQKMPGTVEQWRSNLADSLYNPNSPLHVLVENPVILPDDKALLRSEISDFVLQKTDADTFINNCLVYTDSEEHVINRFLDLVFNIIKDEEQKAHNATSTSTPKGEGMATLRSKTEETLVSLARPSAPRIVDTSGGMSKESLLDEIENPTQTVKQPEYALPKTKPVTLDVLKTMAEKMGAPKQTEVAEEIDLSAIVDPFKETSKPIAPEKIESSIIFSNDPSIAPAPTTEASKITDNLNTKLNSVTATSVKESFKVADTAPKHDPYREAVEL